VIPVYQGQATLSTLLAELERYTSPSVSAGGNEYVISEVLLVFDHGPDESSSVIRKAAQQYDFVRPVWLSRNFGQHAATLAGMASSGSDWIVTMDEDGQHDPVYIADFLDVALQQQANVVYSQPMNKPPHGALRNTASRVTKWIFAHVLTGGGDVTTFQSYRLILGEIGRSVAAYTGSGVFLDVALGWVNPRTATCPVMLREEGERKSGYSRRRLLSHFWRLVITSGTRSLRIISVLGSLFAVAGLLLAMVLVVERLAGNVSVQGWTSVMVAVLVGTGLMLFSLGVIAEYIGAAVNAALGRPPYLTVGDPMDGPLGRRPAVPPDPPSDG
jgi:undecaprenyl-phosphate 4-deoxy-4-formamido-L-arabinose transferase